MLGADKHKRWLLVALAALLCALNSVAQTQRYGPGASYTEIKLGQTVPYSGPASAYGTIGKAELAFFDKINSEGGRRLTFSFDGEDTVLVDYQDYH